MTDTLNMTESADAEWQVLAQLLNGLRQVPTSRVASRLADAKWAVEGEVVLAGSAHTIRVAVPRTFPAKRPEVFLVEQFDSPRLLPHVERDGFVCYAPEGRLTLDPLNPTGVLLGCAKKALSVLSASFSDSGPQALAREFVAFWLRSPSRITVKGFVTPSRVPRRLVAQKKSKNSDVSVVVADDVGTLRAYGQSNYRNIHQRVLYLPLQPSSVPMPPDWGETWGPEEYRVLVSRWCAKDTQSWLKREAARWHRHEFVVFGLPLEGNSFALFGVWFRNVDCGHPLAKGGNAKECVPLHIARNDRSYLLPRGGGNDELSEKRVCLVGCGSVGGLIASALVRAGVRQMMLIDPDTMKPENTFRHVLGKSCIGRGKAERVAADLAMRYPYTDIKSVDGRAEERVTKGDVDPTEFDLAIIAVDDMTAALHLSRALTSQPPKQGVINAWLDPMGLGGHVLTTLPGTLGCLRCLFTDPTSGDFIPNRASFVAEGQQIEVDLGGCGNRFTPFGMLDASQTANLATREALKVLLGKAEQPTLRSWKGNSDSFRAAKYTTSERYLFSQANLDRTQHDFVNPRCPQCSVGAENDSSAKGRGGETQANRASC